MISFYKKECGYRKWHNEKKITYWTSGLQKYDTTHTVEKLSLLAYVPHGTTGLSK